MRIIKSIPLLFLFVLFTTESSAQEITVFPGFWSSEYYQDDKKIDKKELEALFKKNDEVQAYWKKSKGQAVASGVVVVAELGFIIWMYAEILDESRPRQERGKRALGPLIGGLGSSVIAGVLLHASNKSKKRAILTYNKQFDKKTTFRLIPVGNQNGLGLALKF